MNTFFLRRLKIARRAPAFYLKKIRRRLFGMYDSWLLKGRNDCPLGSWQFFALTEKLYGGFKVGTASGLKSGVYKSNLQN
jgi:hypothetical protein